MQASEQQSEATEQQQPAVQTTMLLCLPSGSADEAQFFQAKLSVLFPDLAVLTMSGEDMFRAGSTVGGAVMHNAPQGDEDERWTLTVATYETAARLAVEQNATATLLLGVDALSLSDVAISNLVAPVLAGESDLVLPRFDLGPNEALVSSALLYPFTKALFAVSAHLPLPTEAVLSLRFAGRIVAASSKPAGGQPSIFFWAAAEAATLSLRTREVPAGHRTLPQPADRDLQSLLGRVMGSLFTDLEAKASFWQRGRAVVPTDTSSEVEQSAHAGDIVPENASEIAAMVNTFRSAYDNLQEIWSLVLPPQSLFRVKRLSRTPAEEFTFPPDLWARTAYDFLLAFHQRTINRGHLLGAMTPLYLAWVASHIRQSSGDGAVAARLVEQCAAAFIAEKPYLVSRWRWPDRFNP